MISIIVPVYNLEKYIDYTLQSLSKQSFTDFEVIIIDDGSTDNTKTWIQQWIKNSELNIVYYFQDNQGLSSARNKGIELATGDYLTFIDGDDLIENDYLERLYNAIKENDSDIAMCGFKHFDDQSGNVINIANPSKLIVSLPNGFMHVLLYSACCKLFKHEYIKKYCFRFSIHEQVEDTPFSLETGLLTDKIVVLDYIGYLYRKRLGSITTDKKKIYENPRIPYNGIDMAIQKIEKYATNQNQLIMLRFSVIRILTAFCTTSFVYISSRDRKELAEYCHVTLKTILSEDEYLVKNIILLSRQMPKIESLGIHIFLFAYRIHAIYLLSIAYSKLSKLRDKYFR